MAECNFILSSFPNTEKKQKDLLSIISSIKDLGWDVTLMSHFDCPLSLKNKVDLYIYNDNNTSAFKDSNILNPDIIPLVENTPSYNWVGVGGTSYYDYKGWIDFTPAIMSLFIPALGASFAKGYDFCVYMETDFIFPEDFKGKMDDYFSELVSSNKDSIFFSVPRTHWVHSHLFILRMNERVSKLVPKLNIRQNSDFISKYPNMAFEDFITKVISDMNLENSIFKTRDDLNLFFDGPAGDKWDRDKLASDKNEYTLYTTSVCSPYVNTENNEDVRILLYLNTNSPFSSVSINFSVSSPTLIMRETKVLTKGQWAWYEMPIESPSLKFAFRVESMEGDGISSSDEYIIDTSKLSHISKIRHFVEEG